MSSLRSRWQRVFKRSALVSVCLLGLALQSTGATESDDVRFEYAAKVVCGTQDDAHDLKLVRGVYATAVNVRNPGRKTVEIEKSLALTFPPDEQKPGEIKPISIDQLGPGEALAVDCVDIKVQVFPYGFPRPYIKGFVVIRSTHSLDVTAVYTAAGIQAKSCCDHECCDVKCCGTRPAQHTSIDVERVPERTIGRRDEDKLPDLVPKPPFAPSDPVGLPGTGYCVEPSAGRFAREIRVIVQNIGDADSAPSSTSVVFMPGGEAKQETPALAAGEETALNFALPTACVAGEACRFTITVDADSAIEEVHETNNTTQSLCQTRGGVQ
jgi:hypothetical protein